MGLLDNLSLLDNNLYINNTISDIGTKKINRVLIVATGALFSPTFVFQHETINSIAHAVSLEVVDWFI